MSADRRQWRVAEGRRGDWWGNHGDGTVVIDEHDNPVCATNDDGLPTENDIANARLIAAAPDLLAACADVAEWLQGNSYLDNHAPEIAARLRAALAKAEGGPR